MLGEARVTPTIPVTDLERAKKFYIDSLGLSLVREDPSPGAYLKAGNGTSLYIYQRGESKADHTLAGFSVADIHKAVEEMKAKGVQFDHYDMPGVTWEGDIALMGEGKFKGAWFRDSEGNILALDEGMGDA
jgi:catechol 2,3-dioxygenase-like lactoylglutathione lyase family enzyme